MTYIGLDLSLSDTFGKRVARNGCCCTLRANRVNGGVIEMSDKLDRINVLGGVGERGEYGGRAYHQGNRVYDINGIAPTLTANSTGWSAGHSFLILEVNE